MNGFESAIVRFVEENAKDYAENIEKKDTLTVDPKNEYTVTQYGPIASIEAQERIFELTSNALNDEIMLYRHKNAYSNPGYLNLLEFEDKLQNRFIPTIIKDGIGHVLKKDENEAIRLFKLGPKRF